jgi:hypothetical protein
MKATSRVVASVEFDVSEVILEKLIEGRLAESELFDVSEMVRTNTASRVVASEEFDVSEVVLIKLIKEREAESDEFDVSTVVLE